MAKRELKPLKISCTSTDCDNNLHCFKSTQQMKRRNEQGKCRKCGVDLIGNECINAISQMSIILLMPGKQRII